MKSISLFILSLGIYSLCAAQQPADQSSGGTSGSDTTNPDQQQDHNPYIDQTQSSESNTSWNRSDYYEQKKEPENVRYYSGGHRGTNIINDNNPMDRYREEEATNRMGESQFPDLVRYYSGGHYGNNIINKEEVNRVKSYYYGDPSSTELQQQDSYQPR